MQLSLKSGKYQLLCFPSISRGVRCGFVPSISLLVQTKLNMWGHKHTLPCMEVLSRSVRYTWKRSSDLRHMHTTWQTTSQAFTTKCRAAVWEPCSCPPNCRMQPQPQGCLAQGPLGKQPHRWLAGSAPGQTTDMKARTCEGVTLWSKAYTNTHKKLDNSLGHMKAERPWAERQAALPVDKSPAPLWGRMVGEGGDADGSCWQVKVGDRTCVCLWVGRWI